MDGLRDNPAPMFDIPIVSTAISLIIAWALFSILCSLVHEWITEAKAERGRFYRRRLIQQLRDRPNDINWAHLMYGHGILDLLYKDSRRPFSWVSPKMMARSFIDTVTRSGLVLNAYYASGRTKAEKRDDNLSTLLESPARPIEITFDSNPDRRLELFRAATVHLRQSDVVQMMRSSLDRALCVVPETSRADSGMILMHLETSLEEWFSQLNEQCTIWYAALTRRRLFIVGFLIALLLNVDSIRLFTHFTRNPDSRQAMEAYYLQNRAYFERLSDTLAISSVSDSSRVRIARGLLSELSKARQDAGIPIGMAEWCSEYKALRGAERSVADISSYIVLKLLGLLISGFAAGFGGPFWFDILRKLYQIKSPT